MEPRVSPIWSPTEQAIEQAQITQFARHVVRKYKLELNTYPDFYQWTVDNPEEFWSEVWDWCGVVASKKGSTVLVDGDRMPGAKWFPDARLNFAENLLTRRAADDAGDAALLAAILEMKKAGKTVFAVTHRVNLVSAADKILVLKEGKVAGFGERDAILAAMRGGPAKAGKP